MTDEQDRNYESAVRHAAETDLPKWGNPVAPPHLFSVRELSEELESGARRNGCDSDDQRPRSADSLNRECDSPDQSQPICKTCRFPLDDKSIEAGEHSLCNDPEANL